MSRISDKMYLYGKNSILERLKHNPRSIKKIFLQDNFRVDYILKIIESRNIPIERVSEKGLTKIKPRDRLQGIVAEADRFEYSGFKELIKKGNSKNPTFIFLDNINDPHNLGSIIRIAACFGNFAVVIPEHSSCKVTDAVIHVSSGGENYVPVCKVGNLSNALIKAKEAGYWVVGAVVRGGEDIGKIKWPYPVCLVLGSEGRGIRHGVEKQLDLRVTLPMKGADLSLNVAMSCAIFCYEISKL